MKTTTERTDELLDELIYCDLRTSVGVHKAKTRIRRALYDHSNDTKTACSEAVSNCEEVDSGHGRIRRCEAIGAVMSVNSALTVQSEDKLQAEFSDSEYDVGN